MSKYHLEALELAAEGNWHGAHELIQEYSDQLSYQIHAYLHRVEGDTRNAQYWYHRAGEAMPSNSLPEEYDRLTALAKN